MLKINLILISIFISLSFELATAQVSNIVNELRYDIHAKVVIDKMDSKTNREGIGKKNGSNPRESVIRNSSSLNNQTPFYLKDRIPKKKLMFIVIIDSTLMHDKISTKISFGVKITLGEVGDLTSYNDRANIKVNIPHHFEFRKSFIEESSYEAIIHFNINLARRSIGTQIASHMENAGGEYLEANICRVEGEVYNCSFNGTDYVFEDGYSFNNFDEESLSEFIDGEEVRLVIEELMFSFMRQDIDPTIKHPPGGG